MAEGQQKRLRMELKISGMSCAHCERKVEAAALALEGVESAMADAGKGKLSLVLGTGRAGLGAESGAGADNAAGYEMETVSSHVRRTLAKALEVDGYAVINDAGGAGVRRDGMISLALGLFIAGGFALADAFGIFAIIPTIDAGIGLGALFVTGLLTSLHCVSMCGGIALSQGVKGVLPAGTSGMAAAGRSRGFGDSLMPSLVYNLGRITSYTIIGALAGAAGAALNIGLMGKAVLMGAAGLFMIGMGLNLTGWLKLPRISWSGYDRFRARLGIRASRLGPYAVGLANGFMPCGPLQAMQVYALGSGSAGAGALAMFAFSSGTAPLLFVFGAGGTLVPVRYRAMAIKAGAVLVAFLGLTTLGRAWALSGMAAPWDSPRIQYASVSTGSGTASAKNTPQPAGTRATLVDGIQLVEIGVGPRSYGEIVVQAGIPVRFNLKVAPGLLNGCNNAIVIPALGIQKPLVVGDNIVEFTPPSAGIIPYSCWMGMIRSRITVIEASAGAVDQAGDDAPGDFFQTVQHSAGCCPP